MYLMIVKIIMIKKRRRRRKLFIVLKILSDRAILSVHTPTHPSTHAGACVHEYTLQHTTLN